MTNVAVPDTLVADSTSFTLVTATLAAGTPLDQRQVTFSTSSGRFVAGGKSEGSIVVTADADLIARVVLRAPHDPARAIISATAAGSTVSRNVVFVRRPVVPEVERLTALVAPDSAPADGTTLTEVVAQLAPDTPVAQRIVTFSTTAGAFLLAGKTEATVVVVAGADGRAAALLRSPGDSTAAVLSASAGTTVRTRRLLFARAVPDFLQVVPEQFFVKAGVTNDLVVSATLRRYVGVPSPGVRVVFVAYEPDQPSVPRGRFTTAPPSDDKGVVGVRFTTADSVFTGPLIIRATAQLGAITLRDSALVQVIR
ncbi:hypothetical protein [Gemmatimonas sp.]|uniref:hypothetical protein n=1 Tax=Gemmatimonas sp. TaxID=1962908 RepID=UPI003F72E290